MNIQNLDDERNLAAKGAEILQERCIEVARTETILYVKNDAVWSKAPNGNPVLIKLLSGRSPEFAKKFARRGTYKIKKINN